MNAASLTIDEIRQQVEVIVAEERAQYCPNDIEPEIEADEEPPGPEFMFDTSHILERLYQNQIGDVAIFRDLFNGKYIFDHTAGIWFKWDGNYWIEDITESIVSKVQCVTDSYKTALADISRFVNSAIAARNPDSEAESHEKALRKRIMDLQSRSRIMDVLNLAKSDEEMSTSGQGWDKHPMLFAVKNGIVDLTDGSFHEGCPEHMIRTHSNTEWRGINEPCHVWLKFINDIFDGDEKLISFVHRLIGYCLTGKVTSEIYPVLYGHGGNGKSKLILALQEMMGKGFSGSMGIETIMKSKTENSAGGARADIMDLQGKRLVVAAESDDGHKLNVGKMKLLTGGDVIVARNPFDRRLSEWTPTHKLWLMTNFKPKIPADDYATWRRILLIPFTMSFVDEPKAKNERLKDDKIPERLAAEYSGILAWAVRGCLEWQKIGLQPPEIVRSATQEYRNENDSVSDFISTCCEITQNTSVQTKIIYDSYSEYCQENGLNALRINEFTRQMDVRFDKYSKNKKKFYSGIRLK